MPFVKRNAEGEISAVSQVPLAEFSEELPSGNSELSKFLKAVDPSSSIDATDQDFVRVLEDLVELLVEKGTILFTELPVSAQEKVMRRQQLRSKLSAKLDLIGED